MNTQARIRLYWIMIAGLVLLPGIVLSLWVPLAQGAVAGFAAGLLVALALAPRLFRHGIAKALREHALAMDEMEHKLAQAKEECGFFQEVIQQTPEGVAVFEGEDLRLKWANRSCLEFLEEPYRLSDVSGMPLEEFMPPLARTHLPQVMREVAASHRTLVAEKELECPGMARGVTYWRWKVSALEVDHHPQPKVLLTLADITEQVQARRRSEELAQRLEQMNRAKDKFLATLGHELRNPLAPIQNSLYVLHERGPEDERQRHYLRVIERQAKHMARLVDDLLDVSRIIRGKLTIKRERVELGEVIKRAVESAGPLIESRRHALKVDLPTLPLVLDADPARLEQVLVNLLNNAAKYTEPGGRIWLTAARRESEILIRVRDTGIGIPAEMVPQLFQPFSQIEESLNQSQGGLGLGLALVRSMIELHGGSVELHSEGSGKGSEFTLHLPAPPPSLSIVNGRVETAISPEYPLRILTVEDNPDTSASMCDLLELWGHKAAIATDGPRALELAAQWQPDTVLLDIGLPGMDGYEVARRLRGKKGLESVLILAISGFGQSEDLEQSREAGINHHFTKPIDLTVLHKLLAEYSRHQGQARES